MVFGVQLLSLVGLVPGCGLSSWFGSYHCSILVVKVFISSLEMVFDEDTNSKRQCFKRNLIVNGRVAQ